MLALLVQTLMCEEDPLIEPVQGPAVFQGGSALTLRDVNPDT